MRRAAVRGGRRRPAWKRPEDTLQILSAVLCRMTAADGAPAARTVGLTAPVNAETAPAEAEAVSSLSQHSVRPKGLEPLTF